MEDLEIIALYWARDERALAATAERYGGLCHSIAVNILGSEQDGEECVNDTWLRAWQTMPPRQPRYLSAFLGHITRNLAFSRWRQNHAEKRGGGELALALEELEDCVSGQSGVEDEADGRALAAALDDFLALLSDSERYMFLRRYWYADPIRLIAQRMGRTEQAVAKALSRMRIRLRRYLNERGFDQ